MLCSTPTAAVEDPSAKDDGDGVVATISDCEVLDSAPIEMRSSTDRDGSNTDSASTNVFAVPQHLRRVLPSQVEVDVVDHQLKKHFERRTSQWNDNYLWLGKIIPDKVVALSSPSVDVAVVVD